VEAIQNEGAMNAHEGDLIGSKATESLRLLLSAQPRTPDRTRKSGSGFFQTRTITKSLASPTIAI
jgi:hypothetical protein